MESPNVRPTNLPAGQRETYSQGNYPGRNPFTPSYPRHAVSQPRSWTRKPSTRETALNYIRRNSTIMITAVVVACILIGSLLIAINLASPSKDAVTTVQQPPTAAQVASQLGCTGFKDLGPASVGGSIDSGSCTIAGVKYAINTFESQDIRDSWLKVAEPLGVTPKWETATSVTYKSITAG